MKMKGEKKGITLVALVITIIIMLILATVSITVAINGGLFGYAKRALEEQTIAQYKEAIWNIQSQAKMAYFDNNTSILEETRRLVTEDELFKDAIINQIEGGEFSLTTKEGYFFTVTEEDAIYDEEGEAFNVKIFFIDDWIGENGIIAKSGIIIKDINLLEYLATQKATYSQKESLYWLIFKQVNGDEATKNTMKANTSKITNNQLIKIINDNNNLDYNVFLYKNMYEKFVMDNNDKIQIILSTLSKDSIDTVLSDETGTTTTLERECEIYHCQPNFILDDLMLTKGIASPSGEYIYTGNMEQEYGNYVSILGDDVTVRLPDGREENGSERITYTITKNGTYTFIVTKYGKTTQYQIEVNDIDGNIEEEGYEFIDENYHRHYIKYTDGTFEYGDEEEHDSSIGYNERGNDSYHCNNDGTHSCIVYCHICETSWEVTEACQDVNGTEHIDPQNEETHIRWRECEICHGHAEEIEEEHNFNENGDCICGERRDVEP